MNRSDADRARRMARVARVRTLEERVARAAWAQAQQKAQAAVEALSRAKGEVAGALDGLRALQSGAVLAGSTWIAFQRTVAPLERRVGAARESVRTQAGRAERAREVWATAERARRALEHLVENARTAARVERERVEAARMDEQASFRDQGRRREQSSAPQPPTADLPTGAALRRADDVRTPR